MKLTPRSPQFTVEHAHQDFQSAKVYGSIRGGELCIFHQQLLRTTYLPYSAITHAFLRCQEVKAKMCCGTFQDDQFHLVLVDLEGTEHQLHLDTKQEGETLLQLVAVHQPSAKIGFYK